jgi:hypothetical protein
MVRGDGESESQRLANVQTAQSGVGSRIPIDDDGGSFPGDPSRSLLPETRPLQDDGYEPREINALLAAEDQEESELLQFFLFTGARDLEVQYATWRT